jgi:hypothetical protein
MADRRNIHNRIYQTYLLSYLPLRSSLPYFFQPHVLFLYYPRGMRGRPSWPAESRTNQSAPALTGSLPGERSLVSRR